MNTRKRIMTASACVLSIASVGAYQIHSSQRGSNIVKDIIGRKLPSCPTQSMSDPKGKALRNAAAGKFGIYKISGFVEMTDAPGILCEGDQHQAYENLPYAGGVFANDQPSRQCAPPHPTRDQMVTYNRTMGSTAAFQKATGCRASTVCEETYVKYPRMADRIDPECSTYPLALGGAAAIATPEQLKPMIEIAKAASSNAALELALVTALDRNKAANARLLVDMGVNPNAIVPIGTMGIGRSPTNALEAIMSRMGDASVEEAKWHAAHGMTIDGDSGEVAMAAAITAMNRKGVLYLLANGVTGSGPSSNVKTGLTRYAQSGLYVAVNLAMNAKDPSTRRYGEALAIEFMRRGALIPSNSIYTERLSPELMEHVKTHVTSEHR